MKVFSDGEILTAADLNNNFTEAATAAAAVAGTDITPGITAVASGVTNIKGFLSGNRVMLRLTFTGPWSNSTAWATKALCTLPVGSRPGLETIINFPFNSVWLAVTTAGVVQITSGNNTSGVSSGTYNLATTFLTA